MDDQEGERVDAGTYYVFGIVDDGVNDAIVATAVGRVTVTD